MPKTPTPAALPAHAAAGQPPCATTSSPGQSALTPVSPWRRLMTIVYEAIILFGVVFFFGYAFSALTRYRGGEGLLHTLFQLYLFVVLGIYFGWFWSNGRWSLPMKTLGVKLVRDNAQGSPLSPARAAWRYTLASAFFWGGLALIWQASPWWAPLFLLPMSWTLFDRKRRSLYDVLAGTRLIRQDAVKGRVSAPAGKA